MLDEVVFYGCIAIAATSDEGRRGDLVGLVTSNVAVCGDAALAASGHHFDHTLIGRLRQVVNYSEPCQFNSSLITSSSQIWKENDDNNNKVGGGGKCRTSALDLVWFVFIICIYLHFFLVAVVWVKLERHLFIRMLESWLWSTDRIATNRLKDLEYQPDKSWRMWQSWMIVSFMKWF